MPSSRRRGCLRILPWILMGLVLIAGSAYFIENWRGARELARVKAEVAAAGIELDPHRIPSTRPPDAENFCATPLLFSLGKGMTSDEACQTVLRISGWKDSPMNRMGLPVRRSVGEALQSPSHPEPSDWTMIRDAIARHDRESGLVEGGPDPIGAVAAILERDLTPALADLEAALPRPYSLITPTFLDLLRDSPNPSTLRFPAEGMLPLVNAVHFRAHVDLGSGRQQRAVENIRILLRLAEGAENSGEHGMSLALSGGARGLAIKTTWAIATTPSEVPRQAWLELAAAHRTGTSLDRVRQFWRCQMIHASQMPRALPLNLTEMRQGRRWDSVVYLYSWLFEAMPAGWIDFNIANALEGELMSLQRHSDKTNPYRFDFDRNSARREEWLASRSRFGRAVLARGLFTASTADCAKTVMRSRLAEIACTLEAFHADHQSYPTALAGLVPAYLPSVPDDIDGKPIRYSPDPENGRYRLWSVGEDGIDNGGVEEVSPRHQRSKPRYWFWRTDDWVWQYPPR